jgi:regulator of replication initiation timing
MDEKLLEALNTLIQQKTLSLEAFEIVQDLKTKYEDLSKQFELTQKDVERYCRENEIISAQNTNLTSKLKNIENRESAVTEREKKMMKLEIEHECSRTMVNHTVDMFKTVFANAALKNSIMREVAVPSTYISNGTSSTGIIKEKINETEERQVD